MTAPADVEPALQGPSAHDPAASDPAARRLAERIEWAIGAIGALLVSATIGYLVHRGLQPSMPPSIAITVELVAEQPDGFLIRFEARNHGSEPVAALRVVAERRSADGRREVVAEATIDYLPGGSSRRGGLLFATDPRLRPVKLRAAGYAEP